MDEENDPRAIRKDVEFVRRETHAEEHWTSILVFWYYRCKEFYRSRH